jgi:hypothetical protein
VVIVKPRGKNPLVPIVQEAGWASEPVWTQKLEEKSFRPRRESDLDRPVVQPVARHYTDWATRCHTDTVTLHIYDYNFMIYNIYIYMLTKTKRVTERVRSLSVLNKLHWNNEIYYYGTTVLTHIGLHFRWPLFYFLPSWFRTVTALCINKLLSNEISADINRLWIYMKRLPSDESGEHIDHFCIIKSSYGCQGNKPETEKTKKEFEETMWRCGMDCTGLEKAM